MTARIQTLTRDDFKRFVGNVYFFSRFAKGKQLYELCFEPCEHGFEVALYERFGERASYTLVFPKRCTKQKGYTRDSFGTMERTDETWKTALQLAEEILVTL